MTIKLLKEEVLDRDLCTGCGACSLACPRQVIQFDKDLVVPILNFESDGCTGCDDCYKVCPGADPETEISEAALFGRSRTAEERWLGVLKGAYGATSKVPEIQQASSSGGAATTILIQSQKSLDVEFVLTMGRNREEGWRAASEITTSPDQITSNAQSTYQLAPYLQTLRPLFENNRSSKIAIVGLACHMQAVRKMQRLSGAIGDWARSSIVLLVETACSSNTLPSGTKKILSDSMKIDPSEVKNVRFRAGTYPGRFKATLRDDSSQSTEFWEILDILKKNKTHRCLTCGDWMSGLADISVCDGDPNVFESSVNKAEIAKHGRVIVRTDIGDLILAACNENNVLELWPITMDGFNLGLERKKNRRRHYESIGIKNIPKGPNVIDSFEGEEIVSDERLIDPNSYRRAKA